MALYHICLFIVLGILDIICPYEWKPGIYIYIYVYVYVYILRPSCEVIEAGNAFCCPSGSVDVLW